MAKEEFDVLKLLGFEPCDQSVDYVTTKQQFQLHHLVTEQRHPKVPRTPDPTMPDHENTEKCRLLPLKTNELLST